MIKNKTQSINIIAVLTVLLVLVGVVLLPESLRQDVWALSANYNKQANEPLTYGEWNNLLADFLAKDGGTAVNGGGGPVNNAMTGDLDMGGHRIVNLPYPSVNSDIATMQYVEDYAGTYSDAAQDQVGNAIRYVCGETPHTIIDPFCGSALNQHTNWQQDLASMDNYTVYVDVDTSAAGFTGTPRYFVSIKGSSHSPVKGVTSVYDATATGFRVYIKHEAQTIYPDLVNCLWVWYLDWCGAGL